MQQKLAYVFALAGLVCSCASAPPVDIDYSHARSIEFSEWWGSVK